MYPLNCPRLVVSYQEKKLNRYKKKLKQKKITKIASKKKKTPRKIPKNVRNNERSGKKKKNPKRNILRGNTFQGVLPYIYIHTNEWKCSDSCHISKNVSPAANKVPFIHLQSRYSKLNGTPSIYLFSKICTTGFKFSAT